MVRFIRRDSNRYSKLGKKRKKLQKWRRPTGRDNKIRERRRGYQQRVAIGFRTNKTGRDKLNGKTPLLVHNLKDLETATKETAVIIASVGAKKKLAIINKAQEKGLEIVNMAKEAKHATQ